MVTTEKQKKEAQAFYKEALELLNESGADLCSAALLPCFIIRISTRDTKDLIFSAARGSKFENSEIFRRKRL